MSARTWTRGDLCRVPEYPDDLFVFVRVNPFAVRTGIGDDEQIAELMEATGPLPPGDDFTPDFRASLFRLKPVGREEAAKMLLRTEERLAAIVDELGHQIAHLSRVLGKAG